MQTKRNGEQRCHRRFGNRDRSNLIVVRWREIAERQIIDERTVGTAGQESDRMGLAGKLDFGKQEVEFLISRMMPSQHFQDGQDISACIRRAIDLDEKRVPNQMEGIAEEIGKGKRLPKAAGYVYDGGQEKIPADRQTAVSPLAVGPLLHR